jgi:cell division septal protein FtsQ
MQVPGERPFASAVWARQALDLFKRRLLYFAALVVLGWGIRLALTSSAFEVNEVTVEGHQLLKADQVVVAAGLHPQSIFLIDPTEVAGAVEKLPSVKSAEVTCRLPNKLIIRVEEWQPSYAWKVGSVLNLVSPGGAVMGTTTREEGLLVVVDVDSVPVRQGDEVDMRGIQTASKLRDLLPREVGYTPTYFEYSHTQGVILPSHEGIRVVFGWDEDDLERKAATLAAVMDAVHRGSLEAKLIDLRFGDRPYIQ